MRSDALKVLVVSRTESETTHLRQQLQSRGCQCWFAQSNEMSALADQHAFDLILSTNWLCDATVAKLAAGKNTVFVSYPVRNGCWWLPVLRVGKHCLGDPGLRGNEFAGVISQFIRKSHRLKAAAA